MKHIFFTILMLMFSLNISAKEAKYSEIKIPLVAGAQNIEETRNETFHIISVTYSVQLSDIKSVYDFYAEFFQNQGWESFSKGFSKRNVGDLGEWQSYRTTFTDKGKPESYYSSMWKAKKYPANGSLLLTLVGFDEGKYRAKIVVSISPEVDTSPLFKLQRIIMSDPKNIFIICDAIGGNPFQLDTVNLTPSEKYKDNEMVKEYYKVLKTIIEQYKDFGEKFIY